MNSPTPLERMHTREAIAERISSSARESYLADFVLGAVDGTVTTFAIVAGTAGAGLSVAVALVLGIANVLADGLSMAVGNFLGARADRQLVDRFRRMEERHIELVPEAEREEIRQIFAAKGFEGESLEVAVAVITSDRKRWVDTMLTEEWGLPLNSREPTKSAAVTFAAFVAAGMIPLAPLLFSNLLTVEQTYTLSAVATAITFLLIGGFRGKVVHRSVPRAALETLFVGGAAAAIAFLVGTGLQSWIGGG